MTHPSNTSTNIALRGNVPATYVQMLYDYLEQRGVDASALLAAPRPVSDVGLGRFPVADWKGLLEIAADELGDPMLGLHLGQTITPQHFGVLGYVLLSCGTLAAALERLLRYQRLLYDVNPLDYRITQQGVALSWGTKQGRPGPLVDETAVTALVQFCRNITATPEVSPESLSFVNPAPAQQSSYNDFFDCVVEFDQPQTRIVFALSGLQTPLRKPDPTLIAVLEQQVEGWLAALPDDNDIVMQTRQWIAKGLREGKPSLANIAEHLHLSERSLHRRLTEQGWNFRNLLNDTRGQMASDYLRDPRLQLAEIAQLLGYSDQTAFTRAFREWAGVTPLNFRKKNYSEAASE